MAKKSKNRNRKNVIVANASMFGVPPLLEGEDFKAYNALLTKLRDAVKPADVIDEMWVEDCAYLFWDTLRLRRQKTELIKANMYRGLQTVLETLCPQREASDLTSSWSVGDEEAIDTINELLEAGNLSMKAVEAQTLAEIIDKVERFDRMIAMSEARRNATMREMDRRRSVLAHAMREATDNIEDAEFTEIESPQIEAEPPELETEEVTADESVQESDDVEQEPPYPTSEAAE